MIQKKRKKTIYVQLQFTLPVLAECQWFNLFNTNGNIFFLNKNQYKLSDFREMVNVEALKICVLSFGQQELAKMVANRLEVTGCQEAATFNSQTVAVCMNIRGHPGP